MRCTHVPPSSSAGGVVETTINQSRSYGAFAPTFAASTSRVKLMHPVVRARAMVRS